MINACPAGSYSVLASPAKRMSRASYTLPSRSTTKWYGMSIQFFRAATSFAGCAKCSGHILLSVNVATVVQCDVADFVRGLWWRSGVPPQSCTGTMCSALGEGGSQADPAAQEASMAAMRPVKTTIEIAWRYCACCGTNSATTFNVRTPH